MTIQIKYPCLWIWEREYPNVWFLWWGTLNMWERISQRMFFVMRHSEYVRENIPMYVFCDEALWIWEGISQRMVFVMRHSEYERENVPTYGFCDEALWTWKREYPCICLRWGTLNMRERERERENPDVWFMWEDYPYLWVFVMRYSEHEREL